MRDATTVARRCGDGDDGLRLVCRLPNREVDGHHRQRARPRQPTDQHRRAGAVDDRHGSAGPSGVRFLLRTADRRADRSRSRLTWCRPSWRWRIAASTRTTDSTPSASSARHLRNLRAGRVMEGGSTITQQLARAVRLSPARTFERKVREAMLALRLEERYSKAQILQEYLNTVYFGEGFYGVEAASRGYFGKPASELAPAEAALLAGLVRAPSRDAPCVSVERATGRRNLVLRRMRAQGRISEAELAAGLRTPLPSRVTRPWVAVARVGRRRRRVLPGRGPAPARLDVRIGARASRWPARLLDV